MSMRAGDIGRDVVSTPCVHALPSEVIEQVMSCAAVINPVSAVCLLMFMATSIAILWSISPDG